MAFTDILYVTPAYYLLRHTPKSAKANFLLLAANIGLLLVDHLHFQYNGFLFGILLWSLYFYKTGRLHISSLLFAALLNFKHLFLYIAPAFGLVILMRDVKFTIVKLATVGLTVVSVFVVSLAPFIQHLPQLAERLFPFKRGLTHSYWAPNFWSLYNFADIVLYKLGSVSLDSNCSSSKPHPLTSGVIEENQGRYYQVLPEVQPSHCAILVLSTTVLVLLKILKNSWNLPSTSLNNYHLLLKCIVFSGFSAYIFGWHVHEKAIMTVIVPYSLLVYEKMAGTASKDSSSEVTESALARNVYLVSVFGHASLFGLFFTNIENLLKVVMWWLSALATFPGVEHYQVTSKEVPLRILTFTKLTRHSEKS